MKPPAYFDRVRQQAANRWHQLEADPGLAAPWRQLFRQVQSPRHVLSELLQNADDAGARSATVSFNGEIFTFEHDGRDFTKEQFASLCCFGFSNKSNLHTIGFRGVGFKSTFSLGATVEVLTPSLAVKFHQRHFTEPVWIDDARRPDGTLIRVRVSDPNRVKELKRNLEEWTNSPSSLLFFNSLCELNLNGITIRKRVTRKGPVPNSWHLSLAGKESQKLLLIQSEEEDLPPEAVDELRAERDVSELHIPPCHVELVLGLAGTQRLYVVLPTLVELALPFSINAPFIQDPARIKIKEPGTSPTNRWLLERAGRLLAKTIIRWLGACSVSVEQRAEAYDLLPDVIAFDGTLRGECAEAILLAFDKAVEGEPIILDAVGNLAFAGESVAVPAWLHEIWEPAALRELYGEDHSHVVATEISERAQTAMADREWITVRDEADAISRLREEPRPPKPHTWEQLAKLWSQVEVVIPYDWDNSQRRVLRVVPVQNEELLYAADEVIRLSSKRAQLFEADWKFITDQALVVSGDWLTWLSKLAPNRSAEEKAKTPDALRLLQRLALHEPTPVDRVVAKASAQVFAGGEILLENCVRITQIMAALFASVPEGFKFVTRYLHLRAPSHGIVADDSGSVERLVPETWADTHLLHPAYTASFTACKRQQWEAWVASVESGLHLFIPLSDTHENFWTRCSLEKLLGERCAHKPTEYHYKRNSFSLDDHTFDSELTDHWLKRAKDDPGIWSSIMQGVLQSPSYEWKGKTEAEVSHHGNTYTQKLDCGLIAAAWIHNFRGLACLPDTFGKLRQPAELLVRTPDTEPLMGIEPFVHADLDTPANRLLLRLLGVRDNAADPVRILNRLRALCEASDPAQLITEIARLYEALDRVIARLAPTPLSEVANFFASEALILSDHHDWLSAGEISIFPDPEAGAPGIHLAVQRLAMWPRLGVSERPSMEKTIEWLKSLPSGGKLETAELKRLLFVLPRDPLRIWQTCQHWLTLDNTWTSVARLKFRLTMKEPTKWSELLPSIKRATANLQMLDEETARIEPFASLRSLAHSVEFRVMCCDGKASASLPGWLDELASGLCRARIGSDEETQSIRIAGQRLGASQWQRFARIEVMPYVDGDPAGEPYTPKAFWSGDQLYAAVLPIGRLHKELADEISRPFAHNGVSTAIAACIDRDREFVREYLSACFVLDPQAPDAEQPRSANQPEVTTFTNGQSSLEATHSDRADGESNPDQGREGEEPEMDHDADADTDIPCPRRQDSPHRLTLIERYAKQRGFHPQRQADRFRHPDGRWIRRDEQPFHWVERHADGQIIKRLWVCEQRLSRGIELAYELWQKIKDVPDKTAIVLLSEDHGVSALSGTQLIENKNAGLITLFPARYRLITAE